MVPVAAVDPVPLKLTVKGAVPAAGEEEIIAVGGKAGAIMTGAVVVTVTDAVLVRPAALVTVSMAV